MATMTEVCIYCLRHIVDATAETLPLCTDCHARVIHLPPAERIEIAAKVNEHMSRKRTAGEVQKTVERVRDILDLAIERANADDDPYGLFGGHNRN